MRVELTERQKEVLRLIVRGRTNGQIAEELGLSLDGVKWHVREILGRLGVESREEAAEWWRRNRGTRERMPSWLGWPVAAGFGGAAAAAGVVVVAVVIAVGGGDASPPVDEAAGIEEGETEEPEFLEQPELTLAGGGEGWRVYVDEEGGVPNAEDAVLAIQMGEVNRVSVLEANTGRVAMVVDTLPEPIGLLRFSQNALLISDMHVSHDEWDSALDTHRLLIFDLDAPGQPAGEARLARRLNRIGPGTGGWMTLSNDERFLYWGQYRAPGAFGEGARFRAMDLESMTDSGAVFTQRDCSGGTPPMRPMEETAVIVRCELGAHALVLFDAAEGEDAGLRSVEVDVVEPEAHQFHPRTTQEYTVRWSLAGALLDGIEVVEVVETSTGTAVASHELEVESYYSIEVHGEHLAMLLGTDGRLVELDLFTGEQRVLPYRLPMPADPREIVQIALAR